MTNTVVTLLISNLGFLIVCLLLTHENRRLIKQNSLYNKQVAEYMQLAIKYKLEAFFIKRDLKNAKKEVEPKA